MFDLGFLVFIGFVAAIIGLLVGIGLYRNSGNAEHKVRELNQALADAETKNKQYQQTHQQQKTTNKSQQSKNNTHKNKLKN